MVNYYQILGLENNADLKDIKKAYKLYATKFHPDKNNGDDFFEERFKEIQEAYEVLSNTKKRKLYDQGFNNSEINKDENLKEICPITGKIATKKLFLSKWTWYLIVFSFRKIYVMVSEDGFQIQKYSTSYFWRFLTPAIYKLGRIPILGAGLLMILLFYGTIPLLIISFFVDRSNGTQYLKKGRLRLKNNGIYLDGTFLDDYVVNNFYSEYSGPGGFV